MTHIYANKKTKAISMIRHSNVDTRNTTSMAPFFANDTKKWKDIPNFLKNTPTFISFITSKKTIIYPV